MTILLLHLGAHKTATTATQVMLREYAKFSGSTGVGIIIDPREILDGNDNGFVRTADFSQHLKALFEKSINSGAHTVIYSYEGNFGRPFHPRIKGSIYPQAEAGIDRIYHAAKGLFESVFVFFSIRRPSELIESYYPQLVKEGHCLTFDQFMRWIFITELTWTPLVTLMAERFEERNVHIRDYSVFRQPQDFRNHLEIPLQHSPSKRNVSYGKEQIELALSALPHLKTAQQKYELRKFIISSMPSKSSVQHLNDVEKDSVDRFFEADLLFISGKVRVEEPEA
ncbi:hypothetical protein [Palleronia caenipelagi]|uniref:Sulfotransferase family protein n=1 Tax=Palleronia caenipelagi TaxID=2489174 RepID=A0A547PLD6_9RHOB|nr:hypothetical protein [Palleronia caenipelagi]TRD14955.1 hypothetical protein FEV53_18065 [Palleronia caenipelagi]